MSFKVGLIGCGSIFPMHAEALKMIDSTEIVAVCDINEEKAKQAAKKYNCKYYTDYKVMIESEKLDVVHILTPHYLHAPMTIYALGKCINVLTEKPMAITYEEALKMVEKAKECGKVLGVIFQNRYNPGSILVKNKLESGLLGKPIGARLIVSWHRSNEYYTKSDWRGTWEKEGGGVLINQAIHTFDLLRWLINSEIEYVEGNIYNRTHNMIEVEDAAEGIIKFQNGVLACFWAVTYYTYNAPVELEIHCENGIAKIIKDKGIVQLNDGRQFIAESSDKNKTKSYKEYWGTSHYKQIDDFYKALSLGKEPAVNGEEGLKTQILIEAIYKSAKENRKIFYQTVRGC